jgi:hypothetical protein
MNSVSVQSSFIKLTSPLALRTPTHYRTSFWVMSGVEEGEAGIDEARDSLSELGLGDSGKIRTKIRIHPKIHGVGSIFCVHSNSGVVSIPIIYGTHRHCMSDVVCHEYLHRLFTHPWSIWDAKNCLCWQLGSSLSILPKRLAQFVWS